MLLKDWLADLCEKWIGHAYDQIVLDELLGFEFVELCVEDCEVRMVVAFENYGEDERYESKHKFTVYVTCRQRVNLLVSSVIC